MADIEIIDPRCENLLQFQRTECIKAILQLSNPIIAIFSGNQWGKTAYGAFQYVLRICGLHPVEDKNKLSRHIRCLSSCQPDEDPEATPNMQYHELLKFLPPDLIVDKPTARNKILKVRSKHYGYSYFDFVSWNQDLQKTAMVQRSSLWIDEEAPKAFREESRRRLMAEKGDELITLTPKNALSYMYDDVWLKKSSVIRSPTVAEYMGRPQKETFPKGDMNIACVQTATDDNPTMDKEQIDLNFSGESKDQIEISRYGIFSAATGNIVKAFFPEVHVIAPVEIEDDWTHARGIDYHESRLPWSVGWLSASPEDEWFLWQEFHPAIDGPHAMNTEEIAKSIVRKSRDYYYMINLIDPLANKKQANTLTSTTGDLNRHFYDFWDKRGLGTQCFWEGWDTKTEKGRDIIHTRFKNARKVKRPFNNSYTECGEKKHLPTVWIFDTCPKFIISLKRWGFEEWATTQARAVNDRKTKPRQKYSHDNMVLEAFAKDYRLQVYENLSSRAAGHPSVTGRGYRQAIVRA